MRDILKNIIKNKIELLKYLITGAVNNGIFFIVYYIMLYLNINYKVSYVIGSVVMIMLGFIINKNWVFKYNGKNKIIVIKYLISVTLFIVIGIKLTELLIWTTIFNEYDSVILVIIICAFLSYLVNKKIVFKK